MPKCPKCGYNNQKGANFCTECGFSFTQKRDRVIKIIAIIIISYIAIFFLESVYNIWYEQINSKPEQVELTIESTPCEVNLAYDRFDKTIYIDFDTSKKIEAWQIRKIGNQKQTAVLFMPENKEYKSEPINLKTNENLVINFILKNKKISEYISIKKAFLDKTATKGLNMSEYLSLNDTTLNKLKKKVLAEEADEKRRQQAVAQQRQAYLNNLYRLRQQLYYSGYYGY